MLAEKGALGITLHRAQSITVVLFVRMELVEEVPDQSVTLTQTMRYEGVIDFAEYLHSHLLPNHPTSAQWPGSSVHQQVRT
jgi:hypothetical protein